MFRAISLSLLALACAGSTEVDESNVSGGGNAGSKAGGGSSGLDGSSWLSGGSAQGGSGNANASGGNDSGGSSAAGSGGVAPSKPYYLHSGRTYDQESDYIEWDGPVANVMLEHKDQTSLPADEGGTSCSGGCNEQVTRLEAGSSIWGRFTGFTGINVQLASTDEAGVGQGVFSVCNTDLPAFDLAASSIGLPGFNNMPSPTHPLSPSDDCEWRVKAVGGFVYFRAITVTSPEGSGGSGGTGGSGGSAGTSGSGGFGDAPA